MVLLFAVAAVATVAQMHGRERTVAVPLLRRAEALVRASGRGVTNGFPDALRKNEGPYKDTPVAPPSMAEVTRAAGEGVTLATNALLPKRDNATKALHFADFPSFRPNLTPDEVIKLGSFGGTYFRSIYSAAADAEFDGEAVYRKLPWKAWGWVDGQEISFTDPEVAATTNLRRDSSNTVVKKTPFRAAAMLTSPNYRSAINRFGVSCGGSLDMWESSGWINPCDPYGWFQWYCWFYLGRRTSDDERQIGRWAGLAGPKGRFRNQLINKCAKLKKAVTDADVSPVIRQTLQHWGMELRPDMAKA